jgi:hypothetical protein
MMQRMNSFDKYSSDDEDNTREPEKVDDIEDNTSKQKKVDVINLCDDEDQLLAPTDDENMENQEDEEICNDREDEETEEVQICEGNEICEEEADDKEAKEELKKSEERGTFYYEDGEVRGCYASSMRCLPTPTDQSYSSYALTDISTFEEWVKLSKEGRGMWEECGYTAYNGKVEVDQRSPKCWAINQPNYNDSDDEEPSYSLT